MHRDIPYKVSARFVKPELRGRKQTGVQSTYKGYRMNTKYDVFKALPNDRLVWINRVKGLDEARQLVATLVSSAVDHYLIYDFRERTVVQVFEPTPRALRAMAA